MIPGSRRLRLLVEDAEAVDRLFRQALALQGTAGFTALLEAAKGFRRYSLFNTLLIWTQRRGAVMVGSQHQWRGIGRDITADACPIMILQPFGPIEFVYELGDTEGKPVPGQDGDPFLAFGRVKETTWRRIIASAERSGAVVELSESYGDGLAGTAATLHVNPGFASTHTAAGHNARWRIKVNGRLSAPARLVTLAHELGHIYCGHLGPGVRNEWLDRSKGLTPTQRELEAEAVAWLVSSRAGIEARSADYLAHIVKPEDLSGISVYAIHVSRGQRGPRAIPEASQSAI